MRLICDCGNEIHLVEPENKEERSESEEGVYVVMEPYTFEFWERHDQVGIVCNKCDKAIWMFV